MHHPWRPAADRLVGILRGIFHERLRSVVAYGTDADGAGDPRLSSLVIVTTLLQADLEACATHAHDWHRQRIATPLLLPDEEFRRSFDAFPLEYGEIMRAHELVYGLDPFDGVALDPADLRRACETQVKSHLVHLREAFIESGGSPRAVGEVVAASAPAFAALLRNLGRLSGAAEHDRTSATRVGARLAQLPDRVVADILALERPDALRTTDAARLFPEYLAAVERLAHFVDTWHG
jgi:hypothetical protein